MDEEVNPLERDHSLAVILPGGIERNTTVHGSKPVMDLLVTLCGSYHLNPSDYTVELLSPNKNNISFKPNSPIGLLEAEKIVLKPKGVEEKIRTPYMPEATVRLLINYNKSHKAVVRVNPKAPLGTLLPLVCDKCEFQMESTVLLRDPESDEPLDLSKSLNEHGLREVFAKDTAATAHQHQYKGSGASMSKNTTPTKVPSASSFQDLPKKEKKMFEKKGFLSLFRRQKKKSESEHAVSAPTSPRLPKPRTLSVSTQNAPSPDMPMKRRAPPPPISVSQSIPNNLSTCHLQAPQRSSGNTLRSTKRRAPPPPVANHHQEPPADTIKAAIDTPNILEEVKECEEPESVKLSLSSSPQPSVHKAPDSFRPSIRGKDLSDARSALAKVLTSSLSTGMLVKRLKNSASFPKMPNGASCMSENEPCPENENEIESVLNSNLPSENEWEDSGPKKGLTTFQVVPSRKRSDTELAQDVSEQDQAVEEITPESKSDQSVTVEHSLDQSDRGVPVGCLDQSAQEVETGSCSPPLDNQSSSHLTEVKDIVETPKQDEETSTEAPQSGSSHEIMTCKGELNADDQEEVVEISRGQSLTELNTCEAKACDNQEEEVVQENEDSFPPPPPPVYFNEDLEEVRQASASSSLSGSEPSRSASNGQARSSSEPPSVDNTALASSRFAQAVALAIQRSRLPGTERAVGSQIPPIQKVQLTHSQDPHTNMLPESPAQTF